MNHNVRYGTLQFVRGGACKAVFPTYYADFIDKNAYRAPKV